jgi:hypothetical protein
MKIPHAFVPVFLSGVELLRCDACAMFRGHPLHVETLPGMETVDADRESALIVAKSEDLSAQFTRPLTSVSKKAGNIERDSPLFWGKGSQPTLF